jgi:MFS family permease
MMTIVARPYRRPTESTFSRMAEGFAYVWHERTIRMVLLQLGVVSLVAVPYVVLMPIFADKILHGGPQAMGLLMGSVGTGALLGALILATRRGVLGLERWIALSTVGFGVSLILFAASRTFWLSVGLLLPVGFCMTGQMASSNTLIQTIVPDKLRGRVMSVYSMMFIGMAPFGSLFAGFVAHRFGAPVTVTAGGCACLVAVALIGTRLVASLHRAPEMVVAGEMAAGDPPEEETGRESAQTPRP